MYDQPMLRDNALKGKTFIVTGGGTGLGRSMSKYLMELGASVVISSRKLDVLQKTADELQAETGGRRWQWLAMSGFMRKWSKCCNRLLMPSDRWTDC